MGTLSRGEGETGKDHRVSQQSARVSGNSASRPPRTGRSKNMKRATQFSVCVLLVWGLAVGPAHAQFSSEGTYTEQVVALGMRTPSASAPAAPVMPRETSVNYEHPASAGTYSSRPIGAVQPVPGPALARSVSRNVGGAPDVAMAPPHRMSKCKPDRARACGPTPYPAPYGAIPYGPPPPPCGPVCMPTPVTWY